jgi:hypothetical protein
MTRLQYAVVLVVTIVAGMLGGAISERLFSGGVADAQSKSTNVSAEEFLLLDKSGKVRAGLGLDDKGAVGLILTSKDDNYRLYLSPDERLALKLADRKGTVIWSAP